MSEIDLKDLRRLAEEANNAPGAHGSESIRINANDAIAILDNLERVEAEVERLNLAVSFQGRLSGPEVNFFAQGERLLREATQASSKAETERNAAYRALVASVSGVPIAQHVETLVAARTWVEENGNG